MGADGRQLSRLGRGALAFRLSAHPQGADPFDLKALNLWDKKVIVE